MEKKIPTYIESRMFDYFHMHSEGKEGIIRAHKTLTHISKEKDFGGKKKHGELRGRGAATRGKRVSAYMCKAYIV